MNIEERIAFLKSYNISITEKDIEKNQNIKAIVGMSGGVDSSVCAVLSKLMGYDTLGIFMKNWEEIDEHGVCSSEADFQDVISVCEKIDIPYYSLNFSEEYKEYVFNEFIEEYKKGNTPNPDILCNREIKFKVFYEKVKEFGGDILITGHYCRNEFINGKMNLLKGLDDNKDQSYFLYAINEAVLKNVYFPLGHLEKSSVREIAHYFDLTTKEKKDSTGICFIGERNFKNFLGQYINSQKGNFVNLATNEILGHHDGMCFYTIGQRKGLGLGGPGGPWFVARKDIETNTVFVVEGEEHPALYANGLICHELTWITGEITFPLKCRAKIRYRQKDQDCLVTREASGCLKVMFDRPQRAISVSQSIVFYDNDICLGGGQIKEVLEQHFLE